MTTTPADWPKSYRFFPSLMGTVSDPTITYKNQASNVIVQPCGAVAIVTCMVNLVWLDIATMGSGNIKLGGMPPVGTAPAHIGACDWGGNFQGFAFGTSGNFSLDSGLGLDYWYLVVSFPSDEPINLTWATGIATETDPVTGAVTRPGRIRGRLQLLSDPATLSTWIDANTH